MREGKGLILLRFSRLHLGHFDCDDLTRIESTWHAFLLQYNHGNQEKEDGRVLIFLFLEQDGPTAAATAGGK